MFYASVEMIPELAAAVGVSGPMIALPMQMVANLVEINFSSSSMYNSSLFNNGYKPNANCKTYFSSGFSWSCSNTYIISNIIIEKWK